MIGLTEEHARYIKKQQAKADAIVSNPKSEFYEPEENKRMTAARVLMRKWEKEKAAIVNHEAQRR